MAVLDHEVLEMERRNHTLGGERMMQSWAVERMAQEHRRDLVVQSQAGRKSAALPAEVLSDEVLMLSTQRSATGLPFAGGRTVRRHLGSHVGDLLIRAGTRLGGGNLRTS